MLFRLVNLTVHRISDTSKETVGMGVAGVVDNDIGMAVLCKTKEVRLLGPSNVWQVIQVHKPRISPRATFSGFALQASSCIVSISSGYVESNRQPRSPEDISCFSCSSPDEKTHKISAETAVCTEGADGGRALRRMVYLLPGNHS
jgi:hypothetical protein